MKKFLLLLLTALLLTAFASCGSNTPGKDNPPEDGEEILDTGTLWEKLEGVWLHERDGSYHFILFSRDNGEYTFAAGIMYSGYYLGGTVSSSSNISEDTYEFTVNFPAVEENEENSGYEAFDRTLQVDITDIASEKIKSTDITGSGKSEEYIYAAPSLEESWDYIDNLRGGEDGIMTIAEMLLHAGRWNEHDAKDYYIFEAEGKGKYHNNSDGSTKNFTWEIDEEYGTLRLDYPDNTAYGTIYRTQGALVVFNYYDEIAVYEPASYDEALMESFYQESYAFFLGEWVSGDGYKFDFSTDGTMKHTLDDSFWEYEWNVSDEGVLFLKDEERGAWQAVFYGIEDENTFYTDVEGDTVIYTRN